MAPILFLPATLIGWLTAVRIALAIADKADQLIWRWLRRRRRFGK